MRDVCLCICVNLFLPFQYFPLPDVWKLDIRNARVHGPRVHGYVKGTFTVAKTIVQMCCGFGEC